MSCIFAPVFLVQKNNFVDGSLSTSEPVVGCVYLSLNESEESYYKHCLGLMDPC